MPEARGNEKKRMAAVMGALEYLEAEAAVDVRPHEPQPSRWAITGRIAAMQARASMQWRIPGTGNQGPDHFKR